jgi:hypothetical protein
MECQIQANPKFSKMYWMHDVSSSLRDENILMDNYFFGWAHFNDAKQNKIQSHPKEPSQMYSLTYLML